MDAITVEEQEEWRWYIDPNAQTEQEQRRAETARQPTILHGTYTGLHKRSPCYKQECGNVTKCPTLYHSRLRSRYLETTKAGWDRNLAAGRLHRVGCRLSQDANCQCRHRKDSAISSA